MKNYIIILFILIFYTSSNVWTQSLPPACTESWQRYVATPNKSDIINNIPTFEWIYDDKNVLEVKKYGNGDSIDIKWGSLPGLAKLGVSQTNFYTDTKKDGTVISFLGCNGDTSWSYINLSGVMVNIEDAIACEGDSLNFIDDMGYATSYRWNDTLVADKFSYYAAKADTIKVWVRGTSANGCTSSDTAEVYIYPNPLVDITIDGKAVADSALTGINPVTLDAGTSNGTFYTWNTGDLSPSINILPIDPSEPDSVRYYTVTVKNTFECETKDSIAIFKADPPSADNVPLALTPNGDNKNDTWEIPFLKSYKNASVTVYDRWGNIVFSFKGNYKAWDGKYNGEAVPMGTYYYIIKVSEKDKPFTGNVMIIR